MKNSLIALIYSTIIILSDYFITNSFSMINSALFFFMILFVTLFFKSYRVIYLILFISSSIHYLFFNYFQRQITSIDIYLFFTHIEESLDTLFSLLSIFSGTFIQIIIGGVILWLVTKLKIESYPIKLWIKYSVFLILIYINLNSIMGLQFIDALFHISLQKSDNINLVESPIYPIREVNLNIILVIGESMKYNDFVESKLKKQSPFYKKIYSGAINTDISVPLLINSKTNPLELNKHNEANLFKLAKQNNFKTSFISIQTPNSLRYIKPYLQKKYIDYYKSYSKKEREPYFDFLLLDELKQIDFSENSFVVMQQIGEHSPYKFFKEKISNNPKENYTKSIDYSFKLYKQIHKKLINTKKPFVFIYTSDHGEFTGEGGKYGHNCFDKIIYEVPLFIISNIELPKGYKDIKSHYHISQLITYLLGYNNKLEFSKENSIVNGTMLSREDGFRVMP